MCLLHRVSLKTSELDLILESAKAYKFIMEEKLKSHIPKDSIYLDIVIFEGMKKKIIDLEELITSIEHPIYSEDEDD